MKCLILFSGKIRKIFEYTCCLLKILPRELGINKSSANDLSGTFFFSDTMSLVRHFTRSAVPLRAVLQQTFGARNLSRNTSLLERQLLYPPAVTSWSIVRTYAAKKSKEKKKEKGTYSYFTKYPIIFEPA